MLSKYERFATAVTILYQDIQKIQRNEMAKFGLKGPHARCLLALSHFPEGITAARLGEFCEKDKAAVSRTVAELEKMGLVERCLQRGSRYRAGLTLTEKGRTIADSVNQTAEVAVEKAGAGLGEEERQVFYGVLELISGNLHTLCKEGLNQ